MIFRIEASTNGPGSLFCSGPDRAGLHRLRRVICLLELVVSVSECADRESPSLCSGHWEAGEVGSHRAGVKVTSDPVKGGGASDVRKG